MKRNKQGDQTNTQKGTVMHNHIPREVPLDAIDSSFFLFVFWVFSFALIRHTDNMSEYKGICRKPVRR